ncbi:MAG: DUF1588 domain-containing protein, partial [Myxococcota bacterium]
VQFFKEHIWTPIMSQSCIGCHNPTGLARGSQMILQSADWPGYLEANLATVARLAKLDYDGQPWLLAKPTATIDHGGSQQFAVGDATYQTFVQLIEMLDAPVQCDAQQDFSTYLDGVVLYDRPRTLRKATILMLGRLPTDDERAEAANSDAGLDRILDEIMTEDAFYDFVQEVYNDRFLTDRYAIHSQALDLLDSEDYPDRYWYQAIEDGAERLFMKEQTNRAVAREALALINHVIANSLPFTEILTADYMVVNPFSARAYGVSVAFDDDSDPREFRPVQLPGIPHAGILTSTMMLNRMPTSATNRNRHRATRLFELLLATDIEALGARPIDAGAIEEFNPTRESPTCTVCHANIDPVAGAMQNWDRFGRYRPPSSGWYPEMFHPGFGKTTLPYERSPDAMRWLGEQIAADPRFALAVVHTIYYGLTGLEPLSEPTDPFAATYASDRLAFDAQSAVLGAAADAFVAAGHDFKVAIKELIKSPYFRAERLLGTATDSRVRELHPLGAAQFLTPEALNRKVWAITGYPWRATYDSRDNLMSFRAFRLFYGGIDSDVVNTRIREPNGVMAAVAAYMANDLACLNTARDLAKPSEERLLFPLVETSYVPEDENGFPIPASEAAIRANIRHLHRHLFGGDFAEGDAEADAEIERTFALFLEVWRDGQRGMLEGEYSGVMHWECQARKEFWTGESLPQGQRIELDLNYSVRAWRAVLAYLLSDYRFLHE